MDDPTIHDCDCPCRRWAIAEVERLKADNEILQQARAELGEAQKKLWAKIEAALALLTDPLHKTYITPFELRQTMREAIKALTGGSE
jgi:hypothetical protein